MKKFILVVIGLLLLTSCSHKVFDIDECSDKINHLGYELIARGEKNGYFYEMQYQPTSKLVLQSCKSGAMKANRKSINKSLKELSLFDYYIFKIGLVNESGDVLRSNLSNNEEYFARLDFLDFKMQKCLISVNGIDTTSCEIYQYDRNYGLAPYVSMLIGFKKTTEKSGDRVVVFNDLIFNKEEIVSFKFNNYKISQVLKVKLI